MALKNCLRCGKLFVETSRKICPDCIKDEEADFQKIVEFLKQRNEATIDEVHQQTKVSRNLISKFLREGRFISRGFDFRLIGNCEKCDAPLLEGKYCDKCANAFIESIKSVNKSSQTEKIETKKSAKMHIADRIKRHNK